MLSASQVLHSQELIQFKSADNLSITADFYETEKNDSSKWMLMFHQAEYSRGEYKEAASRMIKVGYNCIAVDMRMGGEVNYVKNETAALAKDLGYPQTMLDCEKDIVAAVEWVKAINPRASVVLFGSSFAGSLCLKVATERNDIAGVIAFSPGEFFEPAISIKNTVQGLKKPAYMACTKSEYEYVKEMTSLMTAKKPVLFKPERGEGLHGSKTLWWESPTRNEYWLSLLFFLNSIN